MVNVPPKVKETKGYDELRRLKNHLRDDYKSLKCKTGSKVKTNASRIRDYLERERLTESQKKEIYESIVNNNASLTDLNDFSDDSPLVSIIIINRNGLKHLRRLFRNFKENVQYPNYEILVVDNASKDRSIAFLEDISDDLPMKVIKNMDNESFSCANNRAAELAEGKYLLLLNNDVEPTYGWLNQMMYTALNSEDTGAVGAKLVYPDCSQSRLNKNKSFKVQHRGIAFREEEGFIKPYNMSNGKGFEAEGNDEPRAAVTAAALLVEKEKYFHVGGMDEGYIYGYEDVDLCLKLLNEGYMNLYCPKALLFHYEFGTQEKNKNNDVRERRLNNKKLFMEKWNKWLRKKLLMDKMNCDLLFSEKPLKVAFAVTETGENTSAGDYFTARALGDSLKKFGWEISFLSRRGSEDWYDVGGDVDVVISLLDAYNTRKIRTPNNLLIKVAWPRNWLSRWVSNPDFADYDIVMAPSETACSYIKEKTGKNAVLLPLATDPEMFNSSVPAEEIWKCDYCFTGSYWNDPREIINMLDPESLKYRFNLYGKNWENFDKFKKYHRGFVSYQNMPQIYRSTRIVVDDANRATKKYGSVNSRVYDAIASGTLVITNGELGAKETFKGRLPVYRSREELNNLLEHYLSNEAERKTKIQELQDFVLSNHTYDHRARTIREALENYILKPKIAIKIPAPSWEEVQEWGDYHMALGLKKELEKKGCSVMLQVLPEWEGDVDARCDTVIVLRGLSRYKPKKQHLNIMWNISHPDDVTIEEYNSYDHVFIASEPWARKIAQEADVPVEALLQCTDPELFYPDPDKKYRHDLLFVGNSRKVHRKILKDLLPTDYDLAVYGTNWKGIIPDKYIKGEHIPNNELRKAYSSCKILLNDHWDDMRDKGFISNRIFDGFASGAFIISDRVEGAETVFGDALVTYETPEELHKLIRYYINNKTNRAERTRKVRKKVLNEYVFKKIVKPLIYLCNCK
jgi:GT2 family glycosyltransferase/spore maturation protein CgeB